MRSRPWFNPGDQREIQSIFTGFFNTHLAVWRLVILGNSIAKNLGYKKIHHLEYDCDIKDFTEIYDNSKLLDDYLHYVLLFRNNHIRYGDIKLLCNR